jgi:hypothetical protein
VFLALLFAVAILDREVGADRGEALLALVVLFDFLGRQQTVFRPRGCECGAALVDEVRFLLPEYLPGAGHDASPLRCLALWEANK